MRRKSRNGESPLGAPLKLRNKAKEVIFYQQLGIAKGTK